MQQSLHSRIQGASLFLSVGAQPQCQGGTFPGPEKGYRPVSCLRPWLVPGLKQKWLFCPPPCYLQFLPCRVQYVPACHSMAPRSGPLEGETNTETQGAFPSHMRPQQEILVICELGRSRKGTIAAHPSEMSPVISLGRKPVGPLEMI